MKEIEIYQYLREINCCKLCCLRYLGHRNSEMYMDIENTLVKVNKVNQNDILMFEVSPVLVP